MAASTSRLLKIGLALLTIVPVILTAIGAWLVENNETRAVGEAHAFVISTHGVAAQPAALERLLAHGAAQSNQWREALAADGSLIAAGGDERARHATFITGTSAVTGAPPVAFVRVRESATEVINAAGYAGLISVLLSAAIWVAFVRRSVGAIRHVEGRLKAITVADPLTGLFNRVGLNRRLQRALEVTASAPDRRVGVLIIDIARFRHINQSLGQSVGDEILREVARRIHGVLHRGDIAARLSGDLFAVASINLSSASAASAMARNLVRAVEPVITIEGRETQLSVSIGIALVTAEATSADELMAQAEVALLAAKASGGVQHRLFDASMQADTRQRVALDMALRKAIATEAFSLAFQPIVAGDGHTITAVEALLRWNDPERGAVSPVEFIPVLEQTGLIVPVGRWVLREACRQAQSWSDHGAMPVTLSVNVSPIQFAEPDFVHQVLEALHVTGFPAQQLQLEVTEGLLLDPTPDLMRKLDGIVDAGVRLAVDDFGMGYSSLAFLKRFRLHALKIDRLFVRDVPSKVKDTAIVRAIVELAHALGLSVTAEGVETHAQFEALTDLGCDSLQGFLFARPMGADAMLDHLLGSRSIDTTTNSQPHDWSTTMASQLEVEFIH